MRRQRTVIAWMIAATTLAVGAQSSIALPASGPDTTAIATATPTEPIALHELTVTAIKQSTYLRREATASTVIEGDETERNQVVSLKTASPMVPNLFIPDYGSRMTSTIYVRGIGTRIDQPAVGLTIDNIPVMAKENYDCDLQDIARIEVLRGPQSTLYGRNTIGGVMNIYTLSPLNYQGTRAIAQLAEHGTWLIGASHYALLTPRMGFSVAAQYGSTQGEYTNQYNGKRCDWERSVSGRTKLEWKPSESWYVANALAWVVSRQGGYPYEWLQTGEIAYNDTCYYRRTSVMDGVTLRKDFEGYSLSSLTSYQFIDDNMTLDQDFTPQPYFTLTQKRREHAITQDLIARSHEDGHRYRWLLGLAGFYRHYTMDAPVTFLDYGIEQLIEQHVNEATPSYPIAWDSRTFALGSHFTSPNWGVALYHESTLNLGAWTLAAGLRLDYEHARLNYRSSTHTGYSIYQRASGTIYAHEAIDIDDSGTLDKHFLQLLPRVSVTWHPWLEKPHTIYLAIARGSKAGGFNTQMFSDVLQQRLMNMMGIGVKYDVERVVGYKPEKAWNYELGGHFECWQGKVQSDLGLYLMDCRDRQLTVFPEGTTTGRMMTNAGRTQSWGGELAMTITPATDTRLSISYGYTHATFSDYNDGKTDYQGYRVPYAPAHTLFAEASQSLKINGDCKKMLTFAANVRAVGDIYWDEANTQRQPFYALLGGSITWQRTKYSIQLWGTNLTQTHYDTFYFVSVQHPFVQRGHSRRLGITLRLNLAK